MGDAGNGGGGSGGAAGSAGGQTGGTGGDFGGDTCDGRYQPLPFKVLSAFTTLNICSGSTCQNAAMPYYFNQIENPNCDEVFPDGGIIPFPDGGADGGTDDGSTPDPDANAGADAEGGPDMDAGAQSDAGDAGSPSDAPSATESAPADASSAPDVSVGSEGGGADAGPDAGPDASSSACYEFLYNPNCPNGTCWGGVIFTQSPGGQADPGVCIAEGATRITFQAKASRPDARIKFGSIRPGLFQTEFFLNISTDWVSYEISIPTGEPYNASTVAGVWNGFSVIVEPQDHPGGTYIFVKDVVWSN
jgi:hypothetical protein